MTKNNLNSKANIAKQFMKAIPFSTELSMSLDLIENGYASISMPYDKGSLEISVQGSYMEELSLHY